ncbi:MAG: hypothetical protein ACT4OK_02315 [Gemmobacter sp.]
MIELLFVACLSGSPAECEEKSVIYTDLASFACMMGAQRYLAEWVETHPNWEIASWKCRVPGTGQRA